MVFRFRKEIWERYHWLPLSAIREDAAARAEVLEASPTVTQEFARWDNMYKNRKKRQSNLKRAVKALAIEAHSALAHQFPRCLAFDPCLLIVGFGGGGGLVWNPAEADLVQDLERLDEQEPHRLCWEFYPGGHPFFRHRLGRWYRSAYALPKEVYPEGWANWISAAHMCDASPLMIAASTTGTAVALDYAAGAGLVSDAVTKLYGANHAPHESSSMDYPDPGTPPRAL
jgi:hypothetical protein